MNYLSKTSLSRKLIITTLSIFSIVGYGVFVFAVAPPPPVGGYTAGTVLDPGCYPGDADCSVALSSGGVVLGNPATSFTPNSIQYVNTSGNQHADSLFTRDSATQDTNILQTTSIPLPSNMYTVDFGNLVGIDNRIGTFTAGETITGGSSGAIATFEYAPTGDIIYITNIVGTFISGETVTGNTSGATFEYDEAFGLFSVGDTFQVLDETNGFNSKGAGTITGTSGTTYTISLTSGSIDGFDVLFDGSSKGVGVISVTYIPGGTTPVTQGFRTNTTGGSELVWLPTTGSNRTLGVNDSGVQWQANGNTFFLPETTPTLGQSLSVISNNGADYTLGWGSGGPIAINGTTLYSSGLTGTGDTDGNNIFFGEYAGRNASYALSNVNFLGYQAGRDATDASYSNFFGSSAGSYAIYASDSNFFGRDTGVNATYADRSNFFGVASGNGATNAFLSNFFGHRAGFGATNASSSNFLGDNAGYGATYASDSNFLGSSAGYYATNASDSNFFGYNAGNGATNASFSNFFGNNAGYSATNALYSNFFGVAAGYNAINAEYSNFSGFEAGYSATNASYSNFFGVGAGYGATYASDSNFLGIGAGYNATNASNSIFIGQNSGYNDTVNNTGDSNDFSILLGPNTNTGGFSNSIALGGSATNTATNQFMIGSSTRPINEMILNGTDAYFNFGSVGNSTGYGFRDNAGVMEYKNNSGSWTPFGGGGADGSIYLNDGTLSGNRTVNGGGNNLFLVNNSSFRAQSITVDSIDGQTRSAMLALIAGSSYGSDKVSLTETNASTGIFSGISVDDTKGVGVNVQSSVGGGGVEYWFPLNDGTANQVITTDGLGQLSWQTIGGGSSPQWYAENASAPGTAPTATGTRSIALGDNAQALASNMFVYGTNAGYGATDAYNSNFFGNSAGYGATDASLSNFFGYRAGYYATNAFDSNFLGFYAGNGATNASGSNFIGYNAGYGTTNASESNFFGRFAGQNATNASYSNFLGNSAGNDTTNASNSNFLGSSAGSSATNAFHSNFLGYQTGDNATNAQYSNFFGYRAGISAENASNSIFIGKNAGNNDTVDNTTNTDDFSILFGANTSTGGFSNSIALGSYATNTASNQFMIGSGTRPINEMVLNGTNAYLNFGAVGNSTGYGFRDNAGVMEYKNNAGSWAPFASSSPISVNGTTLYSSGLIGTGNYTGNNIFFGANAGNGATGATSSNFFGQDAGNGATDAAYSNFFGSSAGNGATNASYSNFFGLGAGENATEANHSNFLGFESGRLAINALKSNFIGDNSGIFATNASNSNFIGASAGYGSTNSSNSIFIGTNSGMYRSSVNRGTQNAANSIFIGVESATTLADSVLDTTTNADDFSILLGNYTSTGGFENSIALGQRAINTASNQFMIGSSTRPINTLILTGASGNTCTLDVTIASPSCSSDERLKTNITDLTSDTLDKLLSVKTVSYNWINFPDKGTQIGFLAQDLEQYFPEIVSEAPNGFKTVSYGGMTPILVEAIREMNLKITTINDTETPNSWRDALVEWFGNVENGIVKLFANEIETKNLCVSDDTGGKTCITKAQLDQLLNNAVGGSITPAPSPSPDLIPDPGIGEDTVEGDSTTGGDVPTDTSPSSGDTPTDTPTPSSDPGPTDQVQ